MAIIECKNCNKPMSDKALKCPHCGAAQNIKEGSLKEPLDFPQPKKHRRIKNKSSLIFFVVCLIILVGGSIFGYIYFGNKEEYQEGKENISREEMPSADVSSEDLNNYAKASDYFDKGEYEKAISILKGFNSKDHIIQVKALVLRGDCHVNMKNYNDALADFEEAKKVANGDTEFTPIILHKEATLFDYQGQYEKALDCYLEIKQKYPSYRIYGNDINYYIENSRARMTFGTWEYKYPKNWSNYQTLKITINEDKTAVANVIRKTVTDEILDKTFYGSWSEVSSPDGGKLIQFHFNDTRSYFRGAYYRDMEVCATEGDKYWDATWCVLKDGYLYENADQAKAKNPEKRVKMSKIN